jgi:hypothetical protein
MNRPAVSASSLVKINGAITTEKNAIAPNSNAVAKSPVVVNTASILPSRFLAAFYSRTTPMD